MTPFKIKLRDVNGSYIGTVTQYLECQFIPKWNGVGAWSIKLAGNSAGASMFQPGCGVFVTLPDGTEFSGHAVSFLDEWDQQSNSGQGTITITGVEDKAILGYRCVLPTPTADYTLQTASANYTLVAAAETAIKTLVNYNLGPAALAARQLPGLQIVADRGTGASASISARYDNLLDLVQRIASPVNMSFNLKSTGSGKWVFDTIQSLVPLAPVRFSRAKGNLLSYAFGQTAPLVTREIVAGAGAGIARNIRVVDSSLGAIDPIWGFLVENFLDRRDTSLSSDLLQAGNEGLSAGIEQRPFTISVVNTDQATIGKDYGLGSTVSLSVRGVTYTDIVTQIEYTSKPNELRIKPTIGGADAVYGRALDIYRVVKSISSRVALLERRY